MPSSSSCIQGCKEFILGQNFRFGQGIHERTFSRIRVPDEADGHSVLPACNKAFLAFLNACKFRLQFVNSLFHQTAIHFKLLLTRAPHSDTHFDSG